MILGFDVCVCVTYPWFVCILRLNLLDLQPLYLFLWDLGICVVGAATSSVAVGPRKSLNASVGIQSQYNARGMENCNN